MVSSRRIYHANKVKIYKTRTKSCHPYVVRSATNNGIRGYIEESEDGLNPGNTISFAQDTFTVFYQNEPYFTGNKVKVLKSKFNNLTPKIAIYIVSALTKTLNIFTWGIGSTVGTIADTTIHLPITKTGEINFEYMEYYIRELELARIRELEAYLKVTGLSDYNLTTEDKALLKKFNKSIDGGG